MSVDRKPSDRFFSNAEQAQRTALHLAEFIATNIHYLRKVDKTGKMEHAANSFRAMLKNGERLTPNQYSYQEAIYEKLLKAAGFDSVNTHHDKRPKGIRV
jgi:hypothetical protein